MPTRINYLKNASGSLGYVRKIAQEHNGILQDFSLSDSDFFAQADDPTYTDGMVTRDPTDLDDLFKLGFAKAYDPGTTTVRNATALEITDFIASWGTYELNIQCKHAKAQLTNNKGNVWRVLVALVGLIVDEFNTRASKTNEVVGQWETFKADVLNASNLGDIKTSVGAMSAIIALPKNRTVQQIKTLIESKIDNG